MFLLAFFVGRATGGGDGGAEETTTTTTSRAPITAPIVVITEAESGRTVRVAPGWIIALQLTGRADPEYAWNLDALNRDLIQPLPGPSVEYIEYSSETEAVFTYSGLALAVGEVQVYARYVTPQGQVEKTFECTIEIVPEGDIPTTTTSSTEEQTTTTAASTTTTTKPPTTTTAEQTTTTEAQTTTTGGSPTTEPPTTEPPTTEPPTTAPPTTAPPTTLPPTTTTTVLPLPPIPPDTIVLGPKANGQVKLAPLSTKTVILALADQPESGYIWALAEVDTAVLRQKGDPTFVADPDDPTRGARVWQFDVVAEKPAVVVLEADYVDAGGQVKSHFFTTVSFD